MKVSVIGLGKLGLPMTAFFASKGHEVVGLDVNEGLVRRLHGSECPIEETGLKEVLSQQIIHFTTNFGDVMDSEITFIIVPTPSLPNGRFDNAYVISALEHLREYEGLAVVVSTIMPGSCKKVFKPLLPNVGICYNPEFVALGSVLHDMEYCDSVLIGEETKESGDLLEAFHRTLHKVELPICRMSWWSAETAKLALNISVTMKIGLANMLAEVCEKGPSGNAGDITKFVGLDSRIGSKYFSGGLGFGGPCFPRDGRAFLELVKELGLNCPTVEANDKFNLLHNESVIKRALTLLKGDTVSILGLTYKASTNVVEESAAIEITNELCKHAKVRVYDPQGLENAQKVLGSKVVYCNSITDCLHESSLCIVSTPWDEFRELKAQTFINYMYKPIVLDCWRILQNIEGLEYHALGVND